MSFRKKVIEPISFGLLGCIRVFVQERPWRMANSHCLNYILPTENVWHVARFVSPVLTTASLTAF